MKNYKKKISVLAFSLVLAEAAHANLIQNGGFETGDFTDRTVSGNQGDTGVDASNPHTGNYSAHFGDASAVSISQTVTDVAGAIYNLSFWVELGAQTPNSFSVIFGGQTLSPAPVLNSQYLQYSYSITGSGSDVLTFSGADAVDYIFLDDISLTPNTLNNVPDGGTTAGLLGFGLAGMAVIRRKLK